MLLVLAIIVILIVYLWLCKRSNENFDSSMHKIQIKNSCPFNVQMGSLAGAGAAAYKDGTMTNAGVANIIFKRR